jgi:biopolymer transport protein ExbB
MHGEACASDERAEQCPKKTWCFKSRHNAGGVAKAKFMRTLIWTIGLVAFLCCGGSGFAQAPSPGTKADSAKASSLPPSSGTQNATDAPAQRLTPIQDLPLSDLHFSAHATPSGPGAIVAQAKPNASLPQDLSPLSMFLGAGPVVKSVMIALALASVMTWTIGLFKAFELFAARGRMRRDLRAIGRDTSLAMASKTLDNRKGTLRAFVDVATLELAMSKDAPDKFGIKERVASRLDRIERAAIRGINKGTGILASIGATAPFVGLFGTVWGIMNSFIGISKSQTTNLAVVAPGIAEALQATAIGLVAAIPAVLVYNWFSRALNGYRALTGDAAAEVMRLVSRDLDRVGMHRHVSAAE